MVLISVYNSSGLVEEKECSKCKLMLPLKCFTKTKKGFLGCYSICKACKSAAARNNYKSNPEKDHVRYKAWYAANKDHKKAYDATRERRRKRDKATKAYREINKERYRQQARQYYWQNRTKQLLNSKRWRQANPLHNAAKTRLYYGKKASAPGSFTYDQFFSRCQAMCWICRICGMPVTVEETSIEHRIPIIRGGSNFPANLAPAHKPCNSAKGNMTEKEWLNSERQKDWIDKFIITYHINKPYEQQQPLC